MSENTPAAPIESDDEKQKRKRAEKARNEWIGFAGRVVAQVVGAVASVVLGLFVLQRYQSPPPAPDSAAVAASTAAAARPRLPRRPGETSLAVLPLDNLSKDQTQEYFSDGMTEALTASLSSLEGIRVTSRTSAMRYKEKRPSIPEIAQALGVDLVVEGSVLQAGDQVRITAQLIDGTTDEHLWAQSYTRTLKDVITIQDEVADAIGRELKGTLARRPGTRAASTRAVDPATYDLYLRGRHAMNLRTPESMKLAIGFFESALKQDPQFALAHVGLAETQALQGSPGMGLRDARPRMERAKASAIKALDLDPTLAEAHTALGGVLFFGERDFAGAEGAFRQAIALNPNYPVAHEWLSVLLGEQGRYDEAVSEANAAVKLNPVEGNMHQGLGMVQYVARRFPLAVAAQRRALELSPALPTAKAVLVKALTLDGRPAEAMPLCQAVASSPPDADALVACVVAADKAGDQALGSTLGQRLQAIRPRPAVAFAQLDAALGRHDQAARQFERLAAEGNLPPALGFDPLFDGFRQHSRWPALAARLRMPPPPLQSP